jgi:SWI/SNF-related matrix-associated actin-dependent regulator of chromatin subfamily A-like protein 1
VTLTLFPYQEAGATFLAGRERAALFDDPGVGKSAQAIGALDMVGAMKILIICPAAVREVWCGELKKFQKIQRRVIKGRDIHDLNLWMRGKAHVLIVSYEMATSWAKRIEGDFIDVVILDEAHYLKHCDTARGKAIWGSDLNEDQWKNKHGLLRWAGHVWALTGTPNSNDAADIWSMMRFCGATRLPRKIFRDRYYRARNGAYSAQHTPRDDMVPELKAAIKSFSLRRTKEEAGLQLPPIWLTNVTVDGDTREVRELMRQYPDLEKAIVDAIEKGGLSFIDAQHVATLRRLVGEAKAPTYLEMLKEELKDGAGKRVVFGIHTAALRRIRSGLESSGIGCTGITGETGERERMRSVEAFQTDPDCRVFVGNIRAAGTGLTLTASADVDMFESDWSPAGNAQALMRVHRIGQKQNVRARFITLANSIDVIVNETVARKTANIAKIGTFSPVGA